MSIKNEGREGNYTNFWIENLGAGPNLSIITLSVIKYMHLLEIGNVLIELIKWNYQQYLQETLKMAQENNNKIGKRSVWWKNRTMLK